MHNQTETQALLDTLRSIPLFEGLTDDELTGMLDSPANGVETFDAKALIVRESEIGKCMYVILDGSVEVILRGGTSSREVTIATLHKGDFFGEQSLLPGSSGRRNASVRALYPCKLFRIDKEFVLLSINRGVVDSEAETMVPPAIDQPEDKDIKELLRSMRLFRSLTPVEIETFRHWLQVVEVGPGNFVIKEDQAGEHLYVVLDGVVEVFLLDEEGKINILARHKRGNYFGEQALMPDSDGKRTAHARTDTAGRLLKVPKEYFRLILNRDAKLAQTLSVLGKQQQKAREKLTKP